MTNTHENDLRILDQVAAVCRPQDADALRRIGVRLMELEGNSQEPFGYWYRYPHGGIADAKSYPTKEACYAEWKDHLESGVGEIIALYLAPHPPAVPKGFDTDKHLYYPVNKAEFSSWYKENYGIDFDCKTSLNTGMVMQCYIARHQIGQLQERDQEISELRQQVRLFQSIDMCEKNELTHQNIDYAMGWNHCRSLFLSGIKHIASSFPEKNTGRHFSPPQSPYDKTVG